MTLEERFAAVCERLLREDGAVAQARMFSSTGLKTAGKFFALARRGEVVLKLPAARVQELVGSGEGRPFEVGGRVMREWVCVRPRDEAACTAYVLEARDFVRRAASSVSASSTRAHGGAH